MPAVKYDYDYYNEQRNNKSSRGIAKNARPVSASQKMSAQKKVSSNKSNVQTRNNTQTKNNTQVKKQNHSSIDVPVMVKKKVVVKNKPEEMKLKKPKSNTKSQHKVEGAKRSIVATALAFLILYFICMRYTQINELSHEVNSLEKTLNSAIALNEQLNAEVDSRTDLNYIEKYAKYQLGMQKPAESQIVRIAYEKQDKISTPVVISEEEESSFFEKFLNDLRNLID